MWITSCQETKMDRTASFLQITQDLSKTTGFWYTLIHGKIKETEKTKKTKKTRFSTKGKNPHRQTIIKKKKGNRQKKINGLVHVKTKKPSFQNCQEGKRGEIFLSPA